MAYINFHIIHENSQVRNYCSVSVICVSVTHSVVSVLMYAVKEFLTCSTELSEKLPHKNGEGLYAVTRSCCEYGVEQATKTTAFHEAC